jgi:glutamyl-tRNA synthetase
MSHTSDHFELLKDYMVKMIQEGKAYLDNTEVNLMRQNRMDGIESPQRNQTPEENMAIFEKMYKGEADAYCVRAKIDM